MTRSIRYWLKNVEETFVLSLIATGILLILQPIMWDYGMELGMSGFLWALIQGICMLSLSIQSLQLISVNIIFGGTRKDALKAMHVSMIVGLLQSELLQVILYFMPFIDKDLQFVAICCTPILFLFGNGTALWVSWLQLKSDKVYKVVFTIFCLIIGAVMGITGAASGDIIREIGGPTIRHALGGTVLIIAAVVSFVVYVVGSFVHGRCIRNMDVRV